MNQYALGEDSIEDSCAEGEVFGGTDDEADAFPASGDAGKAPGFGEAVRTDIADDDLCAFSGEKNGGESQAAADIESESVSEWREQFQRPPEVACLVEGEFALEGSIT